jgi:cell division transport system permease protein
LSTSSRNIPLLISVQGKNNHKQPLRIGKALIRATPVISSKGYFCFLLIKTESMSQIGRAGSKRGKPSYFMSILGVTLVLFLLGIIGWLVINANKLGQYFRESVEVRAYLRSSDVTPQDSTAIVNYIAQQPYVRQYTYVTKEAAKKQYLDDGNNDWAGVLDENPLPNSINFKLKNEYVQSDTLARIEKEIEANPLVSDVQYPKELVTNLNKNINRISLILLVLAIILALVVIVLIDNTIRLAMFSNRFLIKTMQMVGATRWFIAKPLNVRAIINGAISATIAIILVYGLSLAAENFLPELKALNDTRTLILLFVMLLIMGIAITLFSTYRSVRKYLRMKLDELY